MSPPPPVLDARAAHGRAVAEVGGKAAALADLAAAGFDVPPFVVLIPDAFHDDTLTDAARAALDAALAALADGRFAVRSSGRAEDGAADSHAGQFLSLLNVARADVPDAAARVRASGLAPSVTAYRAARGRDGAERPAVVVQAMVEARAAGVAFGADPVSGRRDRVVVSAIAGLGDALVSGDASGESWTLLLPHLEPVERPPAADAALTEDKARTVARLCLAVGAARGGPQDIEWAFGPDPAAPPRLLQARPITSHLRPKGVPEPRLLVFDNSNIVESYPGLVAPLTFSFAARAYDRVYRAFLRLLGVREAVIQAHAADLGAMLGLVDGRLYYNLGTWYRLLSLLPFFSSNRTHMETMMGVRAPLPDEAMAGVAATRDLIGGLRMVLRLNLHALLLPWTRNAFLARIREAVPARTADRAMLDGLPLSGLAAHYRRIEAALLDRWDAPIVNDFLCMMAFGGSRGLLDRWAGPEGVALHNDVMIGQGDIVSAEPARLIRDMAAQVRTDPDAAAVLAREDAATALAHPALGPRLRAYLDRFGDRRIGELKLEQPTLDEAPAPLLRAVLACAQGSAAAPAASDPAATLARLFRGRPLRRALVRLVLGYAKARVRDRENLRFERTRIFGHARRVFLAMGARLAADGLLDRAEDVVLLTVEEVLAAAEGPAATADLRGLVAVRAAERTRCEALPDPPERVLVRGAGLDPGRRLTPTAPGADTGDPMARRGTPCGGGTVRGIARVVHDPAHEQVQRGEILVARHTDPGWIAQFANARAVVAQRGSVLSHSAIVSRELGIPCVVAVPGACAWLRTGDRIAVDGGSGWVRRVDDEDDEDDEDEDDDDAVDR